MDKSTHGIGRAASNMNPWGLNLAEKTYIDHMSGE